MVLVARVHAATAAQRFGPRGTATGFLAFDAYFFALFFRAPPAPLPGLCDAVLAGLAAAQASLR